MVVAIPDLIISCSTGLTFKLVNQSGTFNLNRGLIWLSILFKLMGLVTERGLLISQISGKDDFREG